MRLLAENKDERIGVCKTCPFYVEAKNKCGKCGCHLAIKAAYAGSRCPMGYWGCKNCEVK